MNPVEIAHLETDDVPKSAHTDRRSVDLAPVALFVYNRPEHVQRTLEWLRKNALASSSNLRIFSDGAKGLGDSDAVQNVRTLIRSVHGFHSVTIVERPRNFGLAASVIDGVTQLCDENGEAIVVEDDLLTAPDFLTFMNAALDRYRSSAGVFSIGAFNYGIRAQRDYPADAFFTYRSCSWGWATWRDRWMKADWKVSDYLKFRSDKKRLRKFSRGGGDLPRMLAKQMAGQLDSWAIRWAYAHYFNDAVALLPVKSRIVNIGLDGSGTHCRNLRVSQDELTAETTTGYRFPDSVNPDSGFAAQIQNMHPGSLAGRLGKYLARKLAMAGSNVLR